MLPRPTLSMEDLWHGRSSVKRVGECFHTFEAINVGGFMFDDGIDTAEDRCDFE